MTTNKDKIRAQAQKLLQKGQIDKAIKEFQRLVEEDPKDVRTLLKIGDLQTRAGKHAEATQTYGQVAQFYADQGFFLKAVAVYKQILKIDPTLVDINLKLAELYHQLGLLSDATNQYRQLSQIYEKLGRTDDAIGVLRKMVEIDPENIASRIKLAEMFAKQGMVEEARGEFRAAAAYLKANHRIDDYVKVAERVIHVDPGDLETTRELANIYIQKNDARRALAKLQICFKANPKDVTTLSLLANAFRDLGQTAKTVSVLREIGRLRNEAGDRAGYLDAMRRIADVAPDDAEARQALAQAPAPAPAQPLTRVQAVRKEVQVSALEVREVNRRGPEAAEEIEVSAVEVQPEDGGDEEVELEAVEVEAEPSAPPTADAILRILTEVEVYVKYGLKQKAVEHIQRVFELDPEHREARLKYKDLLLELGDHAGAVAELWRACQAAQRANAAQQARDDVEELLGLDPNHAEGRALLAQLSQEAAPPVPAEPLRAPVPADPSVPPLSYEPSPAAAEIDLDADEPPLQAMVAEPVAIEVDEPVAPRVFSGESELREQRVRPSELAGARAAGVSTSTTISQAGTSELPAAATPSPPAPRRAPVDPLNEDLDALLSSAVPSRAKPAAAPKPAVSAPPPTATPAPAVVPPPAVTPAPAVAPAPVVTAAPPAAVAPDEEEELGEEIEEIRFFLQQGLVDEARDALANLLTFHPEHTGLLAVQAEVQAALAPPAAAPPVSAPRPAVVEPEPEPVVAGELEAEPEPEIEGFESVDIGAELATELAAVDDDFQVSFADVFDEFKKGVAKQVEETDYETHYNLGIAYKEMGLLEDAVREFTLAVDSAAHAIGALTMIGLCQLELGSTEAALQSFLRGLNAEAVTPEEAMALRFEIGQAYAAMGRFREAAKFFARVHAMNNTFRDVATHLAEAERQSGAEEGGEVGQELDALLDETQAEKRARQERAGKISYL